MAGGVESHWEPQTQAQRSPSTSTLGRPHLATTVGGHCSAGHAQERPSGRGEQGRPARTTPSTAKHRHGTTSCGCPQGSPTGWPVPLRHGQGSLESPAQKPATSAGSLHACVGPGAGNHAGPGAPRALPASCSPSGGSEAPLATRRLCEFWGHLVREGTLLPLSVQSAPQSPPAASPFSNTGVCAQGSVPSALQPVLTWDLTYVPHGLILAALCSTLFIYLFI